MGERKCDFVTRGKDADGEGEGNPQFGGKRGNMRLSIRAMGRLLVSDIGDRDTIDGSNVGKVKRSSRQESGVNISKTNGPIQQLEKWKGLDPTMQGEKQSKIGR